MTPETTDNLSALPTLGLDALKRNDALIIDMTKVDASPDVKIDPLVKGSVTWQGKSVAVVGDTSKLQSTAKATGLPFKIFDTLDEAGLLLARELKKGHPSSGDGVVLTLVPTDSSSSDATRATKQVDSSAAVKAASDDSIVILDKQETKAFEAPTQEADELMVMRTVQMDAPSKEDALRMTEAMLAGDSDDITAQVTREFQVTEENTTLIIPAKPGEDKLFEARTMQVDAPSPEQARKMLEDEEALTARTMQVDSPTPEQAAAMAAELKGGDDPDLTAPTMQFSSTPTPDQARKMVGALGMRQTSGEFKALVTPKRIGGAVVVLAFIIGIFLLIGWVTGNPNKQKWENDMKPGFLIGFEELEGEDD